MRINVGRNVTQWHQRHPRTTYYRSEGARGSAGRAESGMFLGPLPMKPARCLHKKITRLVALSQRTESTLLSTCAERLHPTSHTGAENEYSGSRGAIGCK